MTWQIPTWYGTILLALAGWKVIAVSSDAVRTLAGGDHLTADISVSTVVELT